MCAVQKDPWPALLQFRVLYEMLIPTMPSFLHIGQFILKAVDTFQATYEVDFSSANVT